MTVGPRFPLLVAHPGGRVQHAARLLGDGPAVTTLCRKRATPTGDGSGLPYCRGCADRPNPISQQRGSARGMTAPVWPFGTARTREGAGLYACTAPRAPNGSSQNGHTGAAPTPRATPSPA